MALPEMRSVARAALLASWDRKRQMTLIKHNPAIPLFGDFSDVKCSRCTALCCRYFGLEIDTPEDERDFDQLLWFLLHRGVEIYVEDGAWHLNVPLECTRLLPDNRCGIYENRPYICRDYDADGCEFENELSYEHYFKSYEDLIAYMRQKGIPGAYLKPGEELPKPVKVLKRKKTAAPPRKSPSAVSKKKAKSKAPTKPSRKADGRRTGAGR